MTSDSHPIIIERFYVFYKLLNQAFISFPKSQRYTLGEKLERTTIDVLELLIMGSRQPEQREILLNRADAKLELLKLLLKIAGESRALDLKTESDLLSLLDEIGRMLGGWIRATKQSAS